MYLPLCKMFLFLKWGPSLIYFFYPASAGGSNDLSPTKVTVQRHGCLPMLFEEGDRYG